MCKTRRDGELWVFLKFQKTPLTVSLAYNISLKHLGKICFDASQWKG